MSIATELNRIITAKEEIRQSIESKGVNVGVDLKINDYSSKIDEITSGGGGWEQPTDWLDLNDVGDNEIYILVTAGVLAFRTYIEGTYDIDWGDGDITTGCTNATIYQHEYIIGSGGTYCESEQYWQWKLKIHNATNKITQWHIRRASGFQKKQFTPILWINVGASGITTYFNFLNDTNTSSYKLKKFTLKYDHWGDCTSLNQMFYDAQGLADFKLPSSWGKVTTTANMFFRCYCLYYVKLPEEWGEFQTSTTYMFYDARCLSNIKLPSSWRNVTNCTYMFVNCYGLNSIVLPSTWGKINSLGFLFSGCWSLTTIKLPPDWSGVTTTHYTFQDCQSLVNVELPQQSGSTACDRMFRNCTALTNNNNYRYICAGTVSRLGTEFIKDCEKLTGELILDGLFTRLDVMGATNCQMNLSGLRLNVNSNWSGASPQINVSYTNLDSNALNVLFGDLPVMSGKVINITGCLGASTCDRSIATDKGWSVSG
jgi:hypothetical protein